MIVEYWSSRSKSDWGRIRFSESGFRFIVNPDLDALANRMVWIRGCCWKWRHCYSFMFVILMSFLVLLANPRQNWIHWIRESWFGFAHWMDGFTELKNLNLNPESSNRIRPEVRNRTYPSTSKSYVSPIACRCCPISLIMSLSVRDISFTAGLGSHAAGSSQPFRWASAPFTCAASSAADSCSDDLRLPGLRSDDSVGDGCCMAAQSRSFFAGGGVQTVDDGAPSTSLSDEEARVAMRPSTGRLTGP